MTQISTVEHKQLQNVTENAKVLATLLHQNNQSF